MKLPVSFAKGLLVLAAAVTLLPSVAQAQWVVFNNETSTRLVATPSLGASDIQEKDYAWGDVDQDGDVDLVCVRKQPFTSTGRFPNVLFMNNGGVLTDMTAQFASASNVAGSQGFLDATNDRDVALADVNGDGWLDIVTATTLSGSQPKYISHPRIYINLGNSGGVWRGFLFDDENRAPTMPSEPRFCSVSAGDVDNDGDVDLYFGDYQQGGPRPIDLNDRLWINDGTGYFTDESSARMTLEMLESSFGMATAMVDFNGDGQLDIMKDDALNAPQGVSISYNNAANPGFFQTYQIAYSFAPYHINTGDLNNDGKLDFVISDDGSDRYALNTSTTNNVPASFTSQTFSFVGGGFDDGFGSNNLIVDLNNDGWNDILIADVDVDIGGCNRRMHIYRNLGNAPNVTMQEQQVSGQVAGIPTSMLQGTHDVAVFDIDGDGWKDMVIGRCTGTQVWINQPPAGLAFSYPQGLPFFAPPGQPYSFQVQVEGIGGVQPQAGSGTLFVSVNGAPFTSSSMTHLGNNLYQASLPGGTSCIDQIRYYVTAMAGAQTFSDPATAPTDTHSAVAAYGTQITFEDSIEGSVSGWTVVNHASLTAGFWEQAQPNGTLSSGQQAAPNEDAEQGIQNTMCFVTQNGPVGGAAGLADVDGGPTDLISPALNLLGTDAVITYSRWFYSSGADVMEVSVSGDGVNWVTTETVPTMTAGGVLNNAWNVASFRVGNFITPTATVQVRFRVSDNPNDSIVEGGIDLFRVEEFTCEFCHPTLPYKTPGAATLSLCGGNLSSGTQATLKLEGTPPNAAFYLVADVVHAPVPGILGGTAFNINPALLFQFVTNGQGNFQLSGLQGGGGPFTIYAQVLYADPSALGGARLTDAVVGNWLP